MIFLVRVTHIAPTYIKVTYWRAQGNTHHISGSLKLEQSTLLYIHVIVTYTKVSRKYS
jgi:hypothetical protein